MNKRDYIGKVVISKKSKARFILREIHAAYICLGDEKLNQHATRSGYMFKTENGDPFTSGDLYFEDGTLTERFKKEYKDYCGSEVGCSEAVMYWMLTGD